MPVKSRLSAQPCSSQALLPPHQTSLCLEDLSPDPSYSRVETKPALSTARSQGQALLDLEHNTA